MPRTLGFGLCSRFQSIYAELELRFDRQDLEAYKILSMALISSKSGGIPVSIINTLHDDLFAWKLMLVGKGPLLEENSPTEQGRPMFEPGAYFQLSGGGPHAEIRLPWEPRQLKSGDRLGFLAVEESGPGSGHGELEIDMLSSGLALVFLGFPSRVPLCRRKNDCVEIHASLEGTTARLSRPSGCHPFGLAGVWETQRWREAS